MTYPVTSAYRTGPRAIAGLAIMFGSAWSAGAVHAADAAPRWSIGVAAAVSDVPYRKYSTDVLPLPAVSYEGERVYFRGTSLGFKLTDHPAAELSAIVSPLGMRFRSRDSDDPRLRRLSDRDISGLAGLAYRQRGPWGTVQASVQKELTGHGGGTVIDASYGYPLIQGTLTLTPRVGVARTSSALNDYYYGVGAGESARSGLAAYKADAGTTPYFDVSVVQRLGQKWIGAIGGRVSKLPDAVTDSPMVDKSSMKSVFVSVSYLM